jgi:hypothetical protein
VTENQQENGWKRWFTSGRAIAIAAVAAFAALLTNINSIVTTVYGWLKEGPHEISIRNLRVDGTYRANLYDFGDQHPEVVWAKTLPRAETGYIAQLEFVVEKRSDAPAKNCVVRADAAPMWQWLDPAPPPPQPYRPSGADSGLGLERLVFFDWLRWIGRDHVWVGDFPRGPDEKGVTFEVFFREQKRPLKVWLVCERRFTPWVEIEIKAPGKIGTPFVRIRSEWRAVPDEDVP